MATWNEIDASPLLSLSCDERARLQEAHDPRVSAFVEDCYKLYISREPDADNLAFWETFLQVFRKYAPDPAKPGQTFSVYLRSAIRHAQERARAADQGFYSSFGRETCRKIKNALQYMAGQGLDKSDICADPVLLKTVAGIAHVSVDTLRTALQESNTLLSLDDDSDGETIQIKDEQEDIALQFERKTSFTVLHRGIALMTLREKDTWGKNYGPLLSSDLLGFLRDGEKASPDENTPERLARCDDLRPLEKDNCLWGVLLLREYVAFTIAPPHDVHTPGELPRAALNPLLSPERPPHQSKTVAEYLHASRSAVSQRRHTMTAKLRALLDKAASQD